MLHPVNHNLKTICWCGPAALSAVTGHSTAVIVAALKEMTGRRIIKAMYPMDLVRYLRHAGYLAGITYEYGAGDRPTLAAWIRDRKQRPWTERHIVMVTGHFVALSPRLFADNKNRTPIPHKQAPHRRSRVHQVITLG